MGKKIKIGGIRKKVVTIKVSDIEVGVGKLIGNWVIFREDDGDIHLHLLNDEKMEDGILKVQKEYKLEKIII